MNDLPVVTKTEIRTELCGRSETPPQSVDMALGLLSCSWLGLVAW